MTVLERYARLGEDGADVVRRFGSEAAAEHFMHRFTEDGSMAELRDAVQNGDADTAFRAAHTLKGISLNMGFVRLHRASDALTEALRGGSLAQVPDLLAELEREYARVMSVLGE